MTPMQKVDILRAACCVAGCDGEISEHELHLIQKMAAEVGVGNASLEAMLTRAVSDPDFHREQFRVLKSDPQDSLAELFEVALADGGLNRQEIEVLRALAGKLEVPATQFDELIGRVRDQL